MDISSLREWDCNWERTGNKVSILLDTLWMMKPMHACWSAEVFFVVRERASKSTDRKKRARVRSTLS